LHLLKQRNLTYEFRYNPYLPLYENKFYTAVAKGREDIKKLIKKGMDQISQKEFSIIEKRWTNPSKKTSKDLIVISVSRFYEPFSMLTPDGRPAGFLIDFWGLWSQKTGIDISFKFGNWQKTLDDLKDGQSDIHSGLFKTKERKEWIEFSEPIYPIASKLYFYNKNKPIGFIGLEGKKLGVIKGSYQENLVLKKYPNIKTVSFSNTLEVMNALLKDRIYATFGESPEIELLAKRLGILGKLNVYSKFLSVESMHAGIAKEKKELYQKVALGISQISKDEIIELEKLWIDNPELHLLAKDLQKFKLTIKEKEWLKKNQKFTLGINLFGSPFEYFSSDNNYSGIASDYMKIIINQLNIKVLPAIKINSLKEKNWPEILNPTKVRSY